MDNIIEKNDWLKDRLANPPHISHIHRLGLQDSIVCKCESLRKDRDDCKTYYEFIHLLESTIFLFNRRIARIQERIEDEKEPG